MSTGDLPDAADDGGIQGLIARSRDLKRELIEFAEHRRFDRGTASSTVSWPRARTSPTPTGSSSRPGATAWSTASSRSARRTGWAYLAPFELPGDFTWTQTPGVIYDESDGMGFVADYAKIRGLFANPDLAASKEHAKLLHGYLKADSVSPTPLRRLAAAHPDTADAVFRKPALAVLGARLRELAGV
jgi:hypothetical protein